MKLKTFLCALVVCLATSFPRADAGTTLYWDGNGSGIVGGGAGTWNVANLRWSPTPDGSTYQSWVNANQDSAVFGGTAATVTVAATNPTVNVIQTDILGYTFSGGTITFAGADAGVFANHTSGTTTLTSNYTGASLTKTGAGRLELNQANNTIGKYILNAGFVTIAAYNRLGTAPGTLVPDWFTFNGGGLGVSIVSGDLGATRGITIKSGGAFFGASAGANDIQISSPIVGTEGGGLTLTNGAPFYSPYNAGVTVTLLNTSNSWDGPTTIGGASTLKLGASNVIPDTSNVTLSNSATNTFDLNNFSETINRLSGANSSSKLLLGTGTLTINNPTAAGQTFSGIISETGSLVKNGTGTQILAGTNANTYSGTTTVNNGTLQLNKTAGVNAIANGALIIGNGTNTATARLMAANQIGNLNNVTINANGTFDMNNLPDTIGSIAGAGAITNMTDLTLTRTSGTATFSGNYSGTGTLTMNGTFTQQLSGTSTSGDTTVTLGTLAVNGSNTNTGTANVNGGTLLVNGTQATAGGTNVSGGVLGGTGSVTGGVTVNFGALAAGVGGGNTNTFTVDTLTLNGGSLRPTLGAPGAPLGSSDVVTVSGAGAALNFSQFEVATANGVADGTYRVLKYNGGYAGSFSNLIDSTQAGFDSIILIDNTAAEAIDVTIDITERTWVADGPGNWSDSSNWGSAAIPAGPASEPNGPGAIANLGNTTPGNPAKTVTLDNGSKTVGVVNLTGTSNYTIAGANALILDTWGADAVVNVGTGATHSITAPVEIAKKTNITVTGGSDTFTVDGSVSGAGSIVKSGAGKLTLTGVNTYTGGNTVSDGTLLGSTDSIKGTIVNHGAVIFDQAANGTFASAISGTGSVTKEGSGQLSLTVANTFNGSFNLNGGTAAVNNNAALGLANSAVSIANGTTLSTTTTTARTLTYAYTVNGDFTLGQAVGGTAALTLAGTMNLGGGTRTITVDNTTDTISAVISNGGLTKAGTGTLLVNGANTYTGNTTLNAGTVQLTGTSTLGNNVIGTAGTLNFAGGILNTSATRAASTAPVANPINMTADTLVSTTSAATTVDLNFSNDSIVATAGTLTFRNVGADGVNDTFQPRFSGNFSFSRPIVIDNGTTGKTKLMSFNTAGTQTFSAEISGNGSYNRSASTATTGGTTEFTAANTYSGGTSIIDGTLKVNNTSGSGTGSGPVTVGAGTAATLFRGTLAGTGSIDGLITVQEGGTISPGNSIGTLTAAGGLTLAVNSSLNFELGAPGSPYGASDLINVTNFGGLTINGGTINLINAGGLGAGTYKLIDYEGALGGLFSNLSPDPTPPPGFNYQLIDNSLNTSIDLLVTSATLPGDFNLDGKVDAADYVLWRKDPTSHGGPGGYDIWRANFGNPPGSGSSLGDSSGAVPEPAAFALLLFGALSLCLPRRR